jgi:hypothetical protein
MEHREVVVMAWRKPGPTFGPADQQEWTDGVEGGLAVRFQQLCT